MGLQVIRDRTPNEFLEQAGPLLYRDEPTNSLMLGLCGNLLRAKEQPQVPPVLIRIVRGEETVTAAIQTPPMNLVITYADEEQLSILAKHLFETGTKFPGVVGPAAASETFSSIWSKMTGAKTTLGMGQKIYKIEKVTLPATKGILRLAEAHEVDLIAQWLVEFGNESLCCQNNFSQKSPDKPFSQVSLNHCSKVNYEMLNFVDDPRIEREVRDHKMREMPEELVIQGSHYFFTFASMSLKQKVSTETPALSAACSSDKKVLRSRIRNISPGGNFSGYARKHLPHSSSQPLHCDLF